MVKRSHRFQNTTLPMRTMKREKAMQQPNGMPRIKDVIAQVKRDQPPVYANHAQISMTNNEIFLDFFRIDPLVEGGVSVEAVHVNRVIIPHSLGKGFATAIANVIAQYEEDHGTKVPNFRVPEGSEKIKIWE